MNENTKKIVQMVAVVLIVVLGIFLWSKTSDNNTDMAAEEMLTFDSSLLVGEWVSVDDENFKRTFNEDGTFTDTYEGQDDATVSGTWLSFDKDNKPDNFTYPVGDGSLYVVLNDTKVSLNFAVSDVTEEELTMVYLDSGSVLKFKKV